MSSHDWKPMTASLATWWCIKCGIKGFSPHPLPEEGCNE